MPDNEIKMFCVSYRSTEGIDTDLDDELEKVTKKRGFVPMSRGIEVERQSNGEVVPGLRTLTFMETPFILCSESFSGWGWGNEL